MVFKIVLVIFAVIIIVIASMGIHSSFVDPIINQAVFIDVPDEDQISWSFDEESLNISASIWINNTGYYALEDIDLYVNMYGLNTTLLEENIRIERVDPGVDHEVPIDFTMDFNSLPGEITIENLIFDNATFYVTSHLTANYPYSLMDLEFDYESTVEWEGIVNDVEFFYDEVQVSTEGGTNILEIPFEVDTNDVISGVAEVNIALWNEDRDTKYAETSLDVYLGVIDYNWIQFELDDNTTEHFITNSETVYFVSTVSLPDSDVSFDYTVEHEWGAPLRDFEIDDITLDENNVYTGLYFVNDSPKTLDIRIDIEIDNETTGLVGVYNERFIIQPGETLDEEITISLLNVPDFAVIMFSEAFSGYEYEKVVDEI